MSDVFKNARDKAKDALGQSVVKELKKKEYEAVYVSTKEEALEEILKLIPAKASVGVPGTVTVRELGAIEKLKERGCTVYQHWDPSLTTAEARSQRFMEELNADYFLTSANAMTRDGKIVNIDGNGNRVGAMAWGPGTLIFVVSVNKVTPDLEAALARAKSASAPNSIRLNGSAPCTQTGYCVDCDSPARICRAVLILERAVNGRKTHVIMVGEDLGY